MRYQTALLPELRYVRMCFKNLTDATEVVTLVMEVMIVKFHFYNALNKLF